MQTLRHLPVSSCTRKSTCAKGIPQRTKSHDTIVQYDTKFDFIRLLTLNTYMKMEKCYLKMGPVRVSRRLWIGFIWLRISTGAVTFLVNVVVNFWAP
jgi:hypothetical protein